MTHDDKARQVGSLMMQIKEEEPDQGDRGVNGGRQTQVCAVDLDALDLEILEDGTL